MRAIDSGAVDAQRALVGDKSSWPKDALLASNALDNQFQFPLLFYLLTILALVAKKADLVFVLMAWTFVVTRFIHSWIHVTTNRMPGRYYAFMAGIAILTIMWIVFAARILLAG